MQTGNPMTLQITLNDHLVETADKPADSKDVPCFPVFGISKKSNSLEALFQAAHSELQTISNSESIQPVINVPAELLLASSTIEIIHLPSTAVHKTSNFSSSRPILAKFGSSIETIPQPSQPKDVATLLPIAPVSSHDRMNAVVSKPKLPGKYTCSYCFRHCAKPSVLQKHLRAHTGERPYPCNKCGLNFKTKSNLYKHCKTRSHLLQVQSADGSTEQVEVDSSDVSEAVNVEASSAVVEMNRYGAAEEVVSRETEADINESCTDVTQLLIQKQQQQQQQQGQQQDQQLRQQLQNSPAAVPCHMLELPQNCTLLQLPDGVVYIMEKLENGQAILRPLHEQLAISQPPVAVNQQQVAVSQQDSVLAPQQLSFGQPQSMYGQPPSPVRQPLLAVGQSQQAVGQSQHVVVQSQLPVDQSQLAVGQSQLPVGQSQLPVGQSQQAVGQSQLPVGQSQHAVVQSQIAVGQSQLGVGQSQQAVVQSQQAAGQSHQAAGQSQFAVGQSQLPVGKSQLTSSQHELALNEKRLMLNYTDAISSTSAVASKLIPRTAFMSKGLTVPNSELHSTGTEFGPHTKVLTKSLSANSANACYSLGPAIFPMTRSPSLTNCQGITPKLAPIDPKTMTSKAVQDRIAMLISQNASIIDTPMTDAPRPKRIVRQSSEVNVGNSIDGANVPSSKTMVRAKSLTPAEAASLDSMVSHARSDGMRKAASVNFEMQLNDGASRACTNFLSVPPDPNLFGKLPEKRFEPVEPAPRLVRLGLPSQSSSGGADNSTSAPSQQIIQFSSSTNATTRSQSVGDCFHFQLSSSSPHSMNLISSSRHMSADGFRIGTRESLAKDAFNKRRDFAKPRSSNSSNVTIDSDDLEIPSDVSSNHNYLNVTVDKEISKEIVPSNSPEHIILPSNSLLPVRIEIVDPLVAPRRGRPKGSKNRSKLSSATSSTTDFDNSPKITSPSTIPQICVTPAESDVPAPTTESLWKRKLIGRIMSKRSLSMERSASEEISDPLSTPSIISASNSLLQTLISSKVANSCSETVLQRSQSYDAAMPLKKRRKTLTELGRGTAFGTRIEEAGGASSPQRDSSGSRSEKLKSPSDLRSRSPESDVESMARMREDQIDVRKSESCRSPELTCRVNARGTFPIALKLKSDSMSRVPGKYLSTSVSQEDRFAEADVPPILDIGCETINNIPAGSNSLDSRTRKLRYYEVSKQGMVRAISELTLFDKDESLEKQRNFLRSNSDSKNDVFEEEVVASIGIENSALSASLVMSLPTGRSTDVAITQRPVIIMQGDDKMPSIIQDHQTTSSLDKKEVQTDLNLDRPSRSKSDLLFTAACVSEPKTGVLTHSSYWNYKIGRDREHKAVLDTSDAVEHVSKSDPVEKRKSLTEQHKYVGTFDALKEKLSLHEKNVTRRENRIQIFPGGYKSTEEYVYIRGRGKGRYVCGKCGIRCKKPSMLRKHLRTHTDSRPHRCEVCDFGFKTKGNLSKHVKSKSHHARSSSLGSIPGSHRAPMLHKDDRLCVSEQTLAVPDMEMSDCDNADLNSEKDDEEEEDDDVSLELKIEKEEEIEDSTSLIIEDIIPVAFHRTELSTVQDKFRRAKSDSEAAASLLDLSKGDTDVLTEDGAGNHQTTVAASSAFSSNISVVETKRISDVLEARTLSSKRSLSASNIRLLESTVDDSVTKSGICSEQPLVSGATTHCKLPISNNNEVKNLCVVKSDVTSSMFNLSPSTLLPQNSEARSSRLLSVYMLNRPLNKLDMIKTGSTENSSPRPSSGFQPQSSSGFQPLSSSGFQPQSSSGFQPQSSSGFQPLSSSGFQPLSSSGFQPQSSSGFQPQSSNGFQPLSSSGFQPQSSSGFQPQSSSGFQSQSTSGFQPQSSSGTQKSQSSKLIRIPCEIIPVPGRVVEPEEGCVNGKYICPVCQKSFGHQHQLTLHRNIHYLERPHKCQDCDMSFQNRTLLDRHERSVRHQSKSDDPRPYKCDDCSVAFRIHGHLAKHMRSKAHVSKLENVGKMTTDASLDSNEIDENETSLDGGIEDQNNLKSPETIPRIHCPSPIESSPSDRRLRIDLSPVCQKSAEDAEIKRSNKDIPGQEKITSSGSDDVPQQDGFHHKCNICEKTFADIQLFQRHVNSHAELRPFICEQCDAGFTSSHMLTRHLETHKQVRDCCHDICDHCGFTLKENQLDKNAATQSGSGSADLNPSSEDINCVTVLTSPVNKCDCKRTCDKDVSLDTSRLPAFIQSSMFANSGSLLPMRNANIILSCSAVPLSLAGSTGLALLLPNPSNSFSNDSAALLATESGTSVLLPASSLSLPLSLSSALHSVLVSSAGLISRQSSVSPGVINEDHAVTISDIENRSTLSKQ